MLILSRKTNESIKIDTDIEISILEVRKDTVKIAIKAPDNVKIFRSEIYEFIKEENKKARLKEQNQIEQIKKLFETF